MGSEIIGWSGTKIIAALHRSHRSEPTSSALFRESGTRAPSIPAVHWEGTEIIGRSGALLA